MTNRLRSYKYRMSNCHVILITTDDGFSKEFLDYFERNYGIRNGRKGFAKVYVSQNFQEGLEFVKVEKEFHVFVIDKATIDGDWVTYYAQSQDWLGQQLLQYESDSRSIEVFKKLFRAQTFFVVLEEIPDLSADSHLPDHTRIWHMNKQSIFEQIDEDIMAYPRGRGLHMDLRDPITYLPSGGLMEQKLKEVRNQSDQTILFIELDKCEDVKHALSYDDFCEVQLFMADIIEQAVDEQISNAWIGGVSGYFIVAMPVGFRSSVRQRIQTLFEQNVSSVNLSAQGMELKLVFDNQSSLPPDFRVPIND